MKAAHLTKLLALFAILALTVTAFAAVPHTINYQGYLKNTDGSPVSVATSVRFSLYSSNPPRNNPVWSDTHSVTPQNGIYSVQLGSGKPISAPFDVPYWLGVKVAVDAEMALQALSSVPYALRATSVDAGSITSATLADGAVTDVKIGGTISDIRLSSNVALLSSAQTFSGIKTFNPLSGSVPFAVDPAKTGPVANLNAEMVGGQKLADLDGRFTPATLIHPIATQIATLRWDLAGTGGTFSVGLGPANIAFDGANIWVTNMSGNNVTKLRSSDGAKLADYPVGTLPFGVAFDGTNIWVTNFGSASVSKLRASDGTSLGNYPVGPNPRGIAFDGVNIWVASQSGGIVTKLSANDGAKLADYPVGSGSWGVAFDGTYVWVSNAGDGNVTKLQASDGTRVGDYPAGSGPRGVAFDGTNIWVANLGSSNVTKLRAGDGIKLDDYLAGTFPFCLAFDGKNIWVTNSSSNTVTRLRASDGARLGDYSVGGSPSGTAFDGTAVWAANNSDNSVTRIVVENKAAVTTGPAGIMDGAITATKLATSAVYTAAISDGAVTDSKITGPINGLKLGSHTHSGSDISSGTVPDARLSANAALLSSNQTITGIKSFNPATGTVPFTVDAARAGLVNNLNAEMLGGQKLDDLDNRYAPATASGLPPGYAILGNTATAPTGYTFTGQSVHSSSTSFSIKKFLPEARQEAVAAVVNNKLYLIGGRTSAGIEAINEEYDPATNTWATKASMPTARSAATGAVVNNKIYIIGGWNGSSGLATVEEYDPTTNLWTTKAPMPTPRYGLFSAAQNSKIYAIGGFDNDAVNEEYSPGTNSWASKASVPAPRVPSAAVATGSNSVYLFDVRNTFLYNVSGNSWSASPPMNVLRAYSCASEVNGKIYIFGGQYFNDSSTLLASVEEFSPANGAWATVAYMSAGRYSCAAGTINGKVYVMGGNRGGAVNTNEEFTPESTQVTYYIHQKN